MSELASIFQLTRVDPATGQLEPVSAQQRIDAILALPNAGDLVRSLDGQTLYGLVVEAGIDDAIDVIQLASGEQCVALVDLDCWTRDELQVERFETWLEVLMQRDDAGFGEFLDTTDLETLAIWLRERARVFIWEEDREYLDMIDDLVFSSPCGVYAIAVPEDDEDTAGLIRLALERVYAHDMAAGHRLLEATRWELTTDMTETAYQRRSARLGDMGFVPFHEAQEVYAWLDPVAFAARGRAAAVDANTPPIVFSATGAIPPVDIHVQELELRRGDEAGSTLARAMAALPLAFASQQLESVVDAVFAQLRALVNRVLIADAGAPGDLAQARASVRRVDANLSIALDMIAGPDAVIAASALGRVRLFDLHRAGFSATVKLAHEARQLAARGNLSLIDGVDESLLSDEQRELFAGLRRRRPRPTDAPDRLFTSLDDVESAARRLGEVGFCEMLFFGLLRFTRDELVTIIFDDRVCATSAELVGFRSLFATLVLGARVRPGRGFAPLSLSDLHQALASFAGEDPAGALTDAGVALIRNRAGNAARIDALATRFASEVAIWVLDNVGDLNRPVPPSIASQIVVLAP